MPDGNSAISCGNGDTMRIDDDNKQLRNAEQMVSLTSRTASSSSGVFDNPAAESGQEACIQPMCHTMETTRSKSRPLRHDEQACEAHYDERGEADDDLEKGKIHFPQHTLFGRERESKQLEELLESSIQGESLHAVFLEGVSGVGKSALVWDSLLYGNCTEQTRGKPSEHRRRRRRSCWTTSGKYNHNSSTQPFSAILHSLDQLGACIVSEATEALNEIDRKLLKDPSSAKSNILEIARRLSGWYDSDDASTLIAFCPSMESVNLILKRLWKRSIKTAKDGHHRRSGSSSSNCNQRNNRRHSPKPPALQRRPTGGSQDNRDTSETSSVVSEDATNSSSADQQSVVASNDIQQLALALKVFLKGLTSPARPLIWFLDDLQWADDCSLQFVQQFLVTSKPQKNDEANENSYRSLTLEDDITSMLNDTKRDDSVVGLFVGAYRPLSTAPSGDSAPTEDHHTLSEKSEGALQLPLENIVKTVPSTVKMEVNNLPPKAILEFCCATLDMEEEESWPLTNALYSATLGNIFHCRQALEHLVRTNCLYYDVMFFSWTYNLPEDGSALQDIVAESCLDVLALVQSKLQACSELVRAILIRAAYTENAVFGAELLLSLLQATGYPDITKEQLRKALDESTDEGLLLNITWDNSMQGSEFHTFHLLRYKFSHDKVKEATYNLLPNSGPERDRVLLPLATVLIQWAIQAAPSSLVSTDPHPSDGGFSSVPYTIAKPPSPSSNQNWMWFVGVEHLNSIPVDNILGTASDSFQVSTSITLPSIEINRKKLAQWNLRVAEMSIAHSSYQQAIKYLKAALSYLPPDEMWRASGPYYRLSLQIHNKLMEIAVAQGQFEDTKDSIAIVLARAVSLQDKITAFSTKIQLAVGFNDRNYQFGIKEALSVLKLFGINLPLQPTAIEAGLEKMKFKMELQTRPITILGELELIPPSDCKGDVMRLLAEVLHLVLLAKKPQQGNLIEIIALRAMRWTLANGISHHFAMLLSEYGSPLRSKGELNAAAKYAAIVKRLFQRFADELGSTVIRSSDFLFCEFILHAGMLPLQNHPFCDSLEKFIDIYRHALANGAADYAMSSAMHYPLTYFICGRPLNALLDAKLVLFQDKAAQLNMNGFVALFYCARQVLYNLQGKNANQSPTMIKGEDQVMSNLEGRTRDMTKRDFAIYQMMLAVTFGDLDSMEELMNRLEHTPLFDLSFARQTLRETYCGIAAYVLARNGRNSKRNLKMAAEIVKELKRLDRADGSFSKDSGSVNFRPIVLCLAAVEANRVEKYDIAIAACSKRQLLHLKALMCEHAGLHCLEQSYSATPPQTSRAKSKQEQAAKPVISGETISKVPMDDEDAELGRKFLGKAMWLYHDWNAMAKVSQMKRQFPFLQNFSRRAAGVKPSAVASVGSLISSESGRSKSQGTRPSTYFPTENQLGRSSECESIHTAESS